MIVRKISQSTVESAWDLLHSSSPMAQVERLDRVERERLVLISNGQLREVVIEGHVTVVVVDL